ncbi:MAG: Gfo/Idh/MocA family oxidoreductase [Planctomycetaceae bacterium]|nr:Gfo/Idh/MocA family oxidoreductase [Planctomycetaceae bacterium]
MIRLALLSEYDSSRFDSDKSRWMNACARLRGVQITAAAASWPELESNHPDRFDAVILSAPPPRRPELSATIARARKHLLIEGLPVETSEDFEPLGKLFVQHGLRLMIGESLRYDPGVMSVKSALDTARLGRPALLRTHAWLSPDQVGDSRRQLFQQLDLAAWIYQTLPTEVYALRHGERSDLRQVHLGFPESSMAIITLSESLPPGDRYHSYTLIGTTGAAYADDHRQMQLLFQGGSPKAKRTGMGILREVEELREFLAAIDEKRLPTVSGSAVEQSLLLADAVRQSIDLRQPLQLQGGRYVPFA